MFAKVFKSLWDGSLRGKSDSILVFINLLTHADSGGFVDRDFQPISDETGLSLERVKSAVVHLESPDPRSRSSELMGARLERIDSHRDWGWRIVNFGRYRGIGRQLEVQEQNRIRQAIHRAKKTPSPHPSPNADAEANAEAESKRYGALRSVTERDTPLPSVTGEPSASPSLRLPPEALAWNKLCVNLGKVVAMNPKRIDALRNRRKDPFWVANWESAIKKVAASSFCNGSGRDGWKATFDFMLQPNSVLKAMEGNYDDGRPAPKTNQGNLGGNSRALGQYADPDSAAKTAATVARIEARRKAANRPSDPLAAQVAGPLSMASEGSGSSDGNGAMVQQSFPQSA